MVRSIFRVGHAIPSVLAVAAIAKTLALGRFAEQLASFELVPPWMRLIAVFAVPAIEIVPLALCLAGRPRMAAVMSVCVLGLFTGIVLLHLAFGIVPECACFGAWSSFHEKNEAMRTVLVRNSLLLSAASASVFIRPGKACREISS